MPSKKKASRAAQLQPHPVQSDYDTDTHVTDAAATMEPSSARTNTELNMLVLQRYVPGIQRIIAIAHFAVVYLFSPETQQWEKSGVEGTLFVCQISGDQHPRYHVVILNRKGLDNFITELLSGEDIEITEQYVILQVVGEDGTPNIYGLWIFSDEENTPTKRDVVANAIQECAVRAELSRTADEEQVDNGYEAPPYYNLDGAADEPVADVPEPAHPEPTGQQIDLLSLFNKPQAPQNHYSQERTSSSNHPMTEHVESQPTRFVSQADTDFFRASHSPAVTQQYQAQPAPQQNALLDLFKSAKKG